MSADGNGDDGPGRREVAHRLFAAEFEDADLQYSESDEERAPNYVVTPSGARVNRLFFVGVLTELEQVNESMLQARIVDPTGAFVAYAGQYQPDELAFLERVEPPAFLAVTGKARTFQPEDSDRVFTSVRPESINEVDAGTRDRWVVDAARRTVERVEVASRAIESGLAGDALRESLTDEGVDPSLASGIALALDHYGTTPTYLAALRETALDAARVVADEIEEVDGLSVAPDEGGDASLPGRATGADADAAGSTRGSGPTSTTAEAGDGSDATGPAGTTGTDETDAADAGVDAPADAGAGAGVESGTEPDAPTADAGEAPDAASTAEAEPGTSTAPGDGAGSAGGSTDADADDVGEFDVGEFDAGGDAGVTEPSDDDADLAGDEASFDPDEEVLAPDEREQIESEYGTDFSTAGDVEAEPDAAPDPEDDAGPGATDSGVPAESPGSTEPAEPADPDEGTGAPADTSAGTDAEPEPGDETAGDGTEAGGRAAEDPSDEAAPEPSEADAAEDQEGQEDHADAGDGGDDGAAESVDVETAVLEAIDALDDGDGADREAVAARVADEHGVSESAADDAIEEAMMSGRCYEPADGRVKSI